MDSPARPNAPHDDVDDRATQDAQADQRDATRHANDQADKGDDAKGETSDDQKSDKPSILKRPAVRIGLIVAAVVLVIALTIWVVRYETHGKYLQSTNDAMLDADAVTIAPKVAGYVTDVFVVDDQDVKAGAPLVRIDSRDYQSQAGQYQGQLAQALATADSYRAMIREQQAAVAQSNAQYAASLHDSHYQAEQVARYMPLAATGAETQEKLAQLRSQAAQSADTAASQRAAVVSAGRKIASLQAQVRQAEAQADSARAQLAGANVNVGLAMVRASADGRVGDKTVRVGQFVQSGTKMMSLVPLAGLYLTANFKETQIGIMRPGQPATISVDALPGVKLRGHVVSLSPGTGSTFSLLPPQNATGNFTKIVQRVPVRIAVDAGPEARKVLVPGLSVTVEVDTISAKDAQDRIKDQEKDRQQKDRQGNDR